MCCANGGRIFTVADEADILFTAHGTYPLWVFCSLVDTIIIFLPPLPLAPSVVHFCHEAEKNYICECYTHLIAILTHTHTTPPVTPLPPPCHSSDWGCFPLKWGSGSVCPCKRSSETTKNLARPIRGRIPLLCLAPTDFSFHSSMPYTSFSAYEDSNRISPSKPPSTSWIIPAGLSQYEVVRLGACLYPQHAHHIMDLSPWSNLIPYFSSVLAQSGSRFSIP